MIQIPSKMPSLGVFACLALSTAALQAAPAYTTLSSGILSDMTGPNSYALPLSQPDLVSLWAGGREDGRSPVMTLPANAFATPTALERIGGGPVATNQAFQVTKYSNFGTPVAFVLKSGDFDEIGSIKAFFPVFAGPLTMRMKAPHDGSITRMDFKVQEVISTPAPSGEYIELSCSKKENGGRSTELVLGENDIAYRSNFAALGITGERVTKSADLEFIIHSFHLGQKGVYPDYTKRLRYSDVGGGVGPRNNFTNIRTDVSDEAITSNGRTSLQAFRGPCVITIEAVDGGPDWAFQQFYVHRGSGSRFLADNTQDGLRILSQPRDVIAESGDPVTLSVAVEGAANLTYQWLFNGKSIPGATRSALTIENVRAGDEGNYAVVIRGGKDAITSDSAFVDVKGSTPKPSPGPRR